MIYALGFDPSTEGAAWALLRVSSTSREYLGHGDADDDKTIGTILSSTSVNDGTITVIGVETVEGALAPGDKAASRARAKNLFAVNGVAHFIRGYALGRGLHVEAMPSYVADRYLGIRRRSTDAIVASAMRAIVKGWPKTKTTDHHRDAGAVALAAAVRYGPMHGWTS